MVCWRSRDSRESVGAYSFAASPKNTVSLPHSHTPIPPTLFFPLTLTASLSIADSERLLQSDENICDVINAHKPSASASPFTTYVTYKLCFRFGTERLPAANTLTFNLLFYQVKHNFFFLLRHRHTDVHTHRQWTRWRAQKRRTNFKLIIFRLWRASSRIAIQVRIVARMQSNQHTTYTHTYIYTHTQTRTALRCAALHPRRSHRRRRGAVRSAAAAVSARPARRPTRSHRNCLSVPLRDQSASSLSLSFFLSHILVPGPKRRRHYRCTTTRPSSRWPRRSTPPTSHSRLSLYLPLVPNAVS